MMPVQDPPGTSGWTNDICQIERHIVYVVLPPLMSLLLRLELPDGDIIYKFQLLHR